MRRLLLCTWAFGTAAAAAAERLAVGPFVVEAVERRVSAGGFPNTSGNPFRTTPVTSYRVLHRDQPVPLPGTTADRGAPWTDVRVLAGAPRPAVLLMETGAYLLTEVDGQPHLQELAPRQNPYTNWQWLDGAQGQPGPVNIVGLAHRPGPPQAASDGRWLSVYGRAVVDVQTLAVHRYVLNDTPVLAQLQDYYAADRPVLGFSPGATQFVVRGERRRRDGSDPENAFEQALVAFDFATRRGTVLPVDPIAWRLHGPEAIDAGFVRRAVAWRRGPDGREQAFLRQATPAPWLGRIEGREMDATAYALQPVLPSMREELARFLVSEFGAVLSPAPYSQGLEARIGEVTLSLAMQRPQEQRVSLYHAGDFRRKAEAYALIERVAERFNARLAAGQHQAHFVSSSASAPAPARPAR